MMNKNSLLYWYEKTKSIKEIPQPETEIYEIPDSHLSHIVKECIPKEIGERSLEIIRDSNIDFPLFLRTDLASGKHSWKDSCYVEREKDLSRHIYEVVKANLLASPLGLPFEALVFREYIPLEYRFRAFWGEMPIAKERRIFIKNGEIQCSHPYWFEDAILSPSISTWKKELNDLNFLSKKDRETLDRYAIIITKHFRGYWSIDFAKSEDECWYLIDMAKGEDSFHFIDCEFCPKDIKEIYSKKERDKRDLVSFLTDETKKGLG
jgi:hypothetical protein